ncbi:hypothetical protein [Comamonas koreensis]|uniref:Uncharacterized protein n=1 Tax=Comamonas koreensis TaxID=160825 RepID=A0AAW4XSW4_9BURK|nr:hypothetical protein [Comamonas koreensis]MCD2164311.1 hypothetical protein [Comamonas koreensis]
MSNWWMFSIAVTCFMQACALMCLFVRLTDVLDRLNKCKVSVDAGVLKAPVGSTILITPAAPLSQKQFEQLKEYLAAAATGVEFVVLDASLKAQIINGAPE